MSCRRLRFSLAVTALAIVSSCRRPAPRPAIERIAVLRFENLGPDSSSDWIGRAFSEIIASELQSAPGVYAIPGTRLHALVAAFGARPVGAPGVSTEQTAALAAGATKIVYGQYALRGATLDASLTVEDELTGKMTVLSPVSSAPGDLLSAATALAREISPHIGPYGTRSQPVIEAHVEALEGLDNPGVAENLQKAIGTDPNFGPAYLELAQLKIQQKDVPGAFDVLKQAMARGNAIPDRERALIQLEDATMRNDLDARLQALTALGKSDPYDPNVWRDVGAISVATHKYPQAVEALRRVTALAPDDGEIWNQLGYAAAYAGDPATAVGAVKRYAQLQPASPNPLDSLGDVNLIAGHLAEAENDYRESARKNPGFLAGLDLLKAAMAHLMTGDVPASDALAQQYFDARAQAKDPMLDYRKAQWSWISGRRKPACQQMEQVAKAAETAGTRDLAAHAYAELSVWTLMLGNREAAAGLAQKSATLAPPQATIPAGVARFVSQAPATPAEWQKRASQLVANAAQSPLANMALADALLIAKEFGAALPVLQQMYDRGNPAADEGLPILLAWADLETGHVQEAAALVGPNQPLGDVGLSWSTPLHFPRVYYLRALIAEKQGKADEARENLRIFHALSGPDPLLWGEEK